MTANSLQSIKDNGVVAILNPICPTEQVALRIFSSSIVFQHRSLLQYYSRVEVKEVLKDVPLVVANLDRGQTRLMQIIGSTIVWLWLLLVLHDRKFQMISTLSNIQCRSLVLRDVQNSLTKRLQHIQYFLLPAVLTYEDYNKAFLDMSFLPIPS